MLPQATIDSKGRIVIPSWVRQGLNLRPGDKVGIIHKSGKRIELVFTHSEKQKKLKELLERRN